MGKDKTDNWRRMTTISVLVLAMIVIWSPSLAIAQNKVVVIPLSDGGATAASGDATKPDVLAGKTFSSSIGIGLTGTRPPAPVGTDYIDTQHTIQPTNPRFYHVEANNEVGYGIKDLMTGLIWQRVLNESPVGVTPCASSPLCTHTEAIAYCDTLGTWYDVPKGCTFCRHVWVGDWRLPTITELQSLIAHLYWTPALPPDVLPFITNLVNSGEYWSITKPGQRACSEELYGDVLKYINIDNGSSADFLTCALPNRTMYTWCVRGPYDDPNHD